ncbi:MAG: hypothetical protein ACOVO2_11405 [Emticicia sp.]|uniref:hypothetical protein n=1 Tax=Emticicia sp. TaxID=1930953 RepID=UPI003BA66A83
MANITEQPQDIKELVKAKIDSFTVEELESRLEMEAWIDVDIACVPTPQPGDTLA